MYISVLETWYLWHLFKISAKGGVLILRRVLNRERSLLFTSSDSTVVEAQKVMNKVVIETGFSCIPVI